MDVPIQRVWDRRIRAAAFWCPAPGERLRNTAVNGAAGCCELGPIDGPVLCVSCPAGLYRRSHHLLHVLDGLPNRRCDSAELACSIEPGESCLT
eukprot:10239888-Heterocapsa_arctica.AAC.1